MKMLHPMIAILLSVPVMQHMPVQAKVHSDLSLFAPGQACDSYDTHAQQNYQRLLGKSTQQDSSHSPTQIPVVNLNHAYAVNLHAQQEVDFIVTPQRHTLAEGSAAGMVQFKTKKAGLYRVNISDGSWLDLVNDELQLIPTQSFHGRHQCKPLRKFVTYALEANRLHYIQFSGGTEAQVKLVITWLSE